MINERDWFREVQGCGKPHPFGSTSAVVHTTALVWAQQCDTCADLLLAAMKDRAVIVVRNFPWNEKKEELIRRIQGD